MKLVERVKERDNKLREDLERKLKEFDEYHGTRLVLAQTVDNIVEALGLKAKFVWGGEILDIEFEKEADATRLVHRLIDELELREAEKVFDQWGAEPKWYYEIKLGDATLRVYPAPPSKDCIPVAVETKGMFWKCEVVK